jgi:hypothetical protein
VLNVEEMHDGIWLRMISPDDSQTLAIVALIARVREGGPTLLAAWHRDRRQAHHAGRGPPMQKHERAAKRMIEKAGFRVLSA